MSKISLSIRDPETLGLFLLILTHGLASHFSYGFHHPDEHYQILEFANQWTGLAKNQLTLPWEYGEQIRPWFQPLLIALFMKFEQFFGLYDAFVNAELLRFIFSILNILSLYSLWKAAKSKFDLSPKIFPWLGLMWFFPYLHARTSSENLSGILITFAFSLIFQSKSFLQVGILLGFAFLARFQAALGLIGVSSFLLLRDRGLSKNHLRIVLGFLIAVGLGVLIDRIGYGNWVFTPYRYFKLNLLDGVAATYNPYPWYQYFIWIAELNPLVSLPLCYGIYCYWKKNRCDEALAYVLSFILIHLFIKNKEYRFLFPVINLSVVLACIGLSSWLESERSKSWFRPYALMSVIAIAISSFRGAALTSHWGIMHIEPHFLAHSVWVTNRDDETQMRYGYYHIEGYEPHKVHHPEDLAPYFNSGKPFFALIEGSTTDPSFSALNQTFTQHSCNELEAFPAKPFQMLAPRLGLKFIYECKIP